MPGRHWLGSAIEGRAIGAGRLHTRRSSFKEKRPEQKLRPPKSLCEKQTARYFLLRASKHFLLFLLQYMYVPQLPALLRARLPLFFLPFLLPFFAAFFFFFIFTTWVWLSAPGCEPGLTNVAAFSSGSGEKAMAIATAKAVMRVFLIRISQYLPF